MKFWAVLGSRGCREKKGVWADYEQLFGVVFSTFCGQKKKRIWKHCSVRTEKFFGGEVFFSGEKPFFLELILFWNKSVIHRGPYSIVSVKVSGKNAYRCSPSRQVQGLKMDQTKGFRYYWNHVLSYVENSTLIWVKRNVESLRCKSLVPENYLKNIIKGDLVEETRMYNSQHTAKFEFSRPELRSS